MYILPLKASVNIWEETAGADHLESDASMC